MLVHRDQADPWLKVNDFDVTMLGFMAMDSVPRLSSNGLATLEWCFHMISCLQGTVATMVSSLSVQNVVNFP
jgi:hypothetical protein